MKRLTSLLVLFVLLGMAPAAWAGPREEVIQAIRQYAQALREKNTEALAALHAKDAIRFHSISPFRFEGRKAMTRLFVQFWKELPTHRITVHDISLKIYGDSTAVSSLYVVSTLVDRKGRSRTLHLRLSRTHAKIGGKWLIVSYHVSRLPGS